MKDRKTTPSTPPEEVPSKRDGFSRPAQDGDVFIETTDTLKPRLPEPKPPKPEK